MITPASGDIRYTSPEGTATLEFLTLLQEIIEEVEAAVSSSAAWGGILGTLSNQTDLQAELDAKANASHTHTASNITDFNSAADARVASGIATHESAGDPHPQYLTTAEGSAAYQAASAILAGLAGLAGSTPDWTPYWAAGDVVNFFRTTAFTRNLLDDGNAGSAQATLGVLSIAQSRALTSMRL